ncbi:MAG TPA: sigma-70 family RNA polymerase sigma factor [Anaerolineae bacterium]|nr:sigma-70 family RNA polymerase sigma factor [Anaerolineae bacterium]
MDENKLITLAQKGDITAYNRLVIEYQDMVYNVSYRILGEATTADDITQETFIAAHKALKRFRGGSFKSWLMRIATNRCYDLLRKRKRRPQSSLDELTEDNESFPPLTDEDDTGPEEEQLQQELAQGIVTCLDSLPDDQRITTVLCDIEGYAYQEIAEMTAVSLGTVKSRISRARRRLRDCLQSLGELLPAQYRL